MNTIETYLLVSIISYVFVLIFTKPARQLALKVNLVDNPNIRKVHKNSIPLVGGIVVIVASGLALMFSQEFWSNIKDYNVLITGSAILLVIGIIDDKIEIRSIIKLIIQIALAYYVFYSGIKIDSMYGVFGIYELPILVQYILTMLIIVGVINAFNLMDGIDGLSAGLAIIGLSAFSVISYISGITYLTIFYLSLIGSLIGFLRFNLSKKSKIFMGDAGSLVLGFIMVVSGIILIQSAQSTPRISLTLAVVFGVFALPVADSLRVYRRRIKAGYSPFRADRTHFHHLVLYFGIGHKFASLLIIFISAFIVVISVIFGTLINITLAVIMVLISFYIVSKIIAINYQIVSWKAKMKKMEEL